MATGAVRLRCVVCLLSLWFATCPGSRAVPYSASVEIGDVAAAGFVLSVALYDTNGARGDAHAFVDNVALVDSMGVMLEEPGHLGFETMSLDGFDTSLNSQAVQASVGGWNGAFALKISEDRTYYVTLTDRLFEASPAAQLTFDFEHTGTETEAHMGLDALVISLLTTPDLEPAATGLTGRGDIIEVTARSLRTVGRVVLSAVDTGPPPAQTRFCVIRPNPMRREAAIVFDLQAQEDVTLEVFTVAGRLVRVLQRETLAAGRYATPWDGRDGSGFTAHSGVYLLRFRAGGYSVTERLIVVR